MSDELSVCPGSGAAVSSGEPCRGRFDRCLAKEFEDWTGYGEVHHLSVTAYMLQHPGDYSRDGWLEARRRLADYLLAGKPPAEVRRENRGRLDSGRRSWRMTRGGRVALPAGFSWSKTIADVRLDNPEVYCADVVEWARAVLSDTADWAPHV
jgi:hypothetical protein